MTPVFPRLALVVAVAATGPVAVRAEEVPAREAVPRTTEIVPSPAPDALRPPPEGRWQPALLPPNDLTDPPRRYPNAIGGACVGMSAITLGLWASRVEDFALPDVQAAALFVNVMLPDPRGGRGRLFNHPLPARVVVDGREQPLTSPPVLVRIAEIVQNALQPGGGVAKTPEMVRRAHRQLQSYENRIESVPDLRRMIAARGGRMVAGAVGFNASLTESTGHAFVLTVDEKGDVYVWDPNARMAHDAVGSGLLASLKYDLVDSRFFTAVRYEIELPDGRSQARRFQYLFPIESFVTADQVPSLPQRK